jgi:hypothetical protein
MIYLMAKFPRLRNFDHRVVMIIGLILEHQFMSPYRCHIEVSSWCDKSVTWAGKVVALKQHHKIWPIVFCPELLHSIFHDKTQINLNWNLLDICYCQILGEMIAMEVEVQAIIVASNSTGYTKARGLS